MSDLEFPFESYVPLKKKIDSPSVAKGNHLLDQPIAAICFCPPLSIPSSVDLNDWPLVDTCAQDLVEEKQFYSTATRFVPSWVDVVGTRTSSSAKMSAEALYPTWTNVYKPLHFTVPWRCEPELFTRAKVSHPGFNGELKSCNEMVYNEALTYVMMDMLHSLFPDNGKHRFYSTPPIGYGLIGFPHVGYFMAVEWLGKLFMTPVTKPFLLGTADHKAAMEALPDVCFDEFVEVSATGGSWHHFHDDRKLLVKWSARAVDSHFYKIIYCEKYDGFGAGGALTRWRDLYRVYARYSEVVNRSSDHPHALVPARLLFGVSAVLVDMEWVEGVPATDDWGQNDSLVFQVATAITWLAQRKLLYCDARPPNILLREEVAHLIDYDDMILVEEVPKSYDQFRSLLEQVAEHRGQSKADYTLSFEEAPKLRAKVDELLRQSSAERSCENMDNSSMDAQLDVDARLTKRART